MTRIVWDPYHDPDGILVDAQSASIVVIDETGSLDAWAVVYREGETWSAVLWPVPAAKGDEVLAHFEGFTTVQEAKDWATEGQLDPEDGDA